MQFYLGYDVGFFYYYMLASFAIPSVVPAVVAIVCGVIYGRFGRSLLMGLLAGVGALGAMGGWWAVMVATGTPGSFIGSGSSIFAGSAVIAVASACFTWWVCRRRNPSGGY